MGGPHLIVLSLDTTIKCDATTRIPGPYVALISVWRLFDAIVLAGQDEYGRLRQQIRQ